MTSVAVVLFLRHGSSVPNNVHGNNSRSSSGTRSYHEALYFPSSKIAERKERAKKKQRGMDARVYYVTDPDSLIDH